MYIRHYVSDIMKCFCEAMFWRVCHDQMCYYEKYNLVLMHVRKYVSNNLKCFCEVVFLTVYHETTF